VAFLVEFVETTGKFCCVKLFQLLLLDLLIASMTKIYILVWFMLKMISVPDFCLWAESYGRSSTQQTGHNLVWSRNPSSDSSSV